jgi:hypothetical protein
MHIMRLYLYMESIVLFSSTSTTLCVRYMISSVLLRVNVLTRDLLDM